MNYKYITRQAEVDALLPVLMSKPAQGLDTETTGLDPHVDKVILMQIGDEHQQYLIDTRKVNPEPLRPWFESEENKKIGHVLKYDYQMIKGTFGIDVEGMRCTYLGERLLVVGKKDQRGFKLDDCLPRRGLVEELDKDLQTSFIGHTGEFSEAQLEYAARDVLYTLPHARMISKDMKETGIAPTWVLECRALSAFADMEFQGQILDKEQWLKVKQSNIDEAAQLKRRLDEFVAPFCNRNLFDEIDTINYDSPGQVLQLLKDMKLKVKERDPRTGVEKEVLIRKTDKATQKKLQHLPIMQLIEKYRSAKKGIGTYGDNYIDAIHPITGRIHPDVDQIGTKTGRPANRGEVSFLNVPRDNRYRNALISLPDWLIETDDYSGCELRILAELSGEPRWTEAFLKGEDVHCVVASDLYGVVVTKKNENKRFRTPGKELNLGLSYGMGPGKLCDKLNAAGFPTTFEEAKKLYDQYVQKYDYNTRFLRDSGFQATRQGFLSNKNGRRRYFDLPDPHAFEGGVQSEEYRKIMSKIRRDGGNFMVQSVNADMSKLAMIKLRKYQKQNGIRTEMINQIYDEIVTHTHKDHSAHYVEVKRKLMVEAAACWLKNVPMVVDGHVGHCWHKD